MGISKENIHPGRAGAVFVPEAAEGLHFINAHTFVRVQRANLERGRRAERGLRWIARVGTCESNALICQYRQIVT